MKFRSALIAFACATALLAGCSPAAPPEKTPAALEATPEARAARINAALLEHRLKRLQGEALFLILRAEGKKLAGAWEEREKTMAPKSEEPQAVP